MQLTDDGHFLFCTATGKNIVLLPVGAADDGAHSQNEKVDVRNYIEGVSIIRRERERHFVIS